MVIRVEPRYDASPPVRPTFSEDIDDKHRRNIEAIGLLCNWMDLPIP